MFDLAVCDYVYIGVILLSTVWATIRGGVYETMATLAWVVAALAARFISPELDGVFQGWFGLTESAIGSLIAAYFVVFFVILVGFSFINQKLRDKVQDSVLKVTDHTLGVIFGIIRGIVIMGLLYWGALWYYARADLPDWIASARTRPVMQLTAVKIHRWFVPGENRLLEHDVLSSVSAQEIYDNLINPAVRTAAGQESGEKPVDPDDLSVFDPKADTGYKESERGALENQLLQLEAKAEADAHAVEEMEKRRQLREAAVRDAAPRAVESGSGESGGDKAPVSE
jgi:membrane protein required for colicin V production